MIRNGNIERNYPARDDGTADGICADHRLRYEFASKYTWDRKVIDLAMGCGYGSVLLKASDYTGIDVAEDAVDYAKKYYTGNFLWGDLNNPTDIKNNLWNQEHYDWGVSFETVEHLTNIEEYLKFLDSNCDNIIISSPIKSPGGGLHSPYHTQEWGWLEFIDLVDPILSKNRRMTAHWEFDDGTPYIVDVNNPRAYDTSSGVIILCYFKDKETSIDG